MSHQPRECALSAPCSASAEQKALASRLSVSILGQLVVENPARGRSLQQFGLDYCCQGRKPLVSICAEKGLPLDDVCRALASLGQSPTAADYGEALGHIVEHLERVHHAPLRGELQRLSCMLGELAVAEGASDPRLPRIRDAFSALGDELREHMVHEEEMLFPFCHAFGKGSAGGVSPNLLEPVKQMIREHDDTGHEIERIRTLASDYEPPTTASALHRGVFEGLKAMEADMHRHVYEENNILFPLILAAGKLAS